MAINLFFNHYETPDRQHEVDYCLMQNRKSFDNLIVVGGRPTFSELFAMTKDYPDDINCFCNSDIYMPDTSLLNKIGQGYFWCLSRWDIKNGKHVLFNRSDSQDFWAVRGVIRNMDVDFTSGCWGADNRIAYEAQKVGYIVINPSVSVKTIHVHAVDNRNHIRTPQNTVPPPYLTIPPTALKNI